MNIGENIRKARKNKGMTMKELGEIIGISEQAVGNYERGDRKPSIEIVNKIAIALQISTTELLEINNLGNLESFINDSGKISHVVPQNKNLPYSKLENIDDITLISEYISRKADKYNHLVSDFQSIIDDVDSIIDGDIAKQILGRGTKIE